VRTSKDTERVIGTHLLESTGPGGGPSEDRQINGASEGHLRAESAKEGLSHDRQRNGVSRGHSLAGE
jgi:hypothetical protein